mgnify:CR=1 FL=1
MITSKRDETGWPVRKRTSKNYRRQWVHKQLDGMNNGIKEHEERVNTGRVYTPAEREAWAKERGEKAI